MLGEALGWSHVASGLSSITIILIGYQIHRTSKQETKLDGIIGKVPLLVTCAECRELREHCPNCKKLMEVKETRKEAWNKHEINEKDFKDEFYHHSHTELTDKSVVKIP